MSSGKGNSELQSPSPLGKSTVFGPLLILASAFLDRRFDDIRQRCHPQSGQIQGNVDF
jgi:hypothetical protein